MISSAAEMDHIVISRIENLTCGWLCYIHHIIIANLAILACQCLERVVESDRDLAEFRIQTIVWIVLVWHRLEIRLKSGDHEEG